MTQSTAFRITIVLVGALILLGAPALVQAQNTCDKQARPCLDQPHEGDTQVTGKLTLDDKGKPPTGAAVDIKVGGKSIGSAQVDPKGTFALKGLHALSQYDTVQADQTAAGAAATSSGAVTVSATQSSSTSIAQSTMYTLGLFGLNATGTSSWGPSQQYFAEFDLIAPLRFLGKGCRKDGDKPIAQACWFWINPRIASLPSASTTALSSLSSSSLTTGANGQTVGQITQTFEFQTGAEYYLIKPMAGKYWGSGDNWGESAFSLIVGGGLVTPFNSISAAPEFTLNKNLGQQFNQISSLPATYPQLALALCSYGYTGANCPTTAPSSPPTIAAFVFPNRSRFYRDWYGGLRFRFFYFTGDCSTKSDRSKCDVTDTYPGTIDVRFGEDETVTSGHLLPVVMTFTGSFPIPGTKGVLRVFGSSYTRLKSNQNTTALIALPVTSFTSLDSPTVVVQQVARSDQDYYRLGVGVDLIALINKWFSSTTTKSAAAPSAP